MTAVQNVVELPDEVVWLGAEDFWRYGLLAAVAFIRSSADLRETTVSQIVGELADRHGVSLPAVVQASPQS